MRILITLLLLACTTIGYSQNITLTGTVTDPDNLPLESATVYLSSVKDSTLVEYTITDSKGNWVIKTRATTKELYLKVSFVGFTNYQKKVGAITADTDFGTVKMAEGTDLKEVVIEGEVPPIRIKQDTLEFDAASFKVRPDANVQSLLKQLPGVDIDDTGKITVNGKEVNQILVNGKPFFDKDGKIALQNLPAEVIKKVQVTDTKTKREELAKQRASGDNSTINFTIDEDKNKGIFGKVMGGYGTDDRYESNAIVNYFKGKQKISLLAASNNINSSGFSNDEIFDSMGGGRNMSVWSGGDGSTYINGVRVGGGSGITTTNAVGLNYADEWLKDLTPALNYFYTSTNSKNDSRSRNETFLPDNAGSLINESVSRSENIKFSNNIGTEFQYKIDSTSTLFFDPKFIRSNSKSTRSSTQTTTDDEGTLLNEANGQTLADSDNSNFASSINYFRTLSKKGRSVNVELTNSNTKDDAANINNTVTRFYEDTNDDGTIETREDIRNQLQKRQQVNDSYALDLLYTEPISDSIDVSIGTFYNRDNSIENNKGFDYDGATNDYTAVNDLITSYYQSKTSKLNPYAIIHLKKKKIDINGNIGTALYNFDNYGEYLGEQYRVNKNFVLPTARVGFRYRFDRGKTFYSGYSFNVNMPSARQILPISDVSSALSTISGNADLKPAKNHSINLSYNNYDWATRSGYYLYGGATINETQIVNYTIVDSVAKRNTTYRNINGGYNARLGGNFSKSIKTEKGNTYRYTLGIRSNYSLDKGFTNATLYTAKAFSVTPNVNFNYDLGELLSINPSYSYTFNDTRYTNFDRAGATNFVHKATLLITNYWPKHFVVGNDFNYTYNSQLSAGYKKDFFLWNTSVGYNFLADKMLFKVKVYDLLNQNLGTGRTITPNGINDYQNTVLKRYLMFSLTYKINQFGGKKGNNESPGGRSGRRGPG
ncbi:outer membrane beta-barrel protein [Flavobacterium sp. RHBU_24]|uniref:outer membrane beta-barrel protein n=1 Tax=Flavobacterium sp. RHBU_24 TaxID=3391185 RepID=UPI003984A384